jgi:hypothetical protein
MKEIETEVNVYDVRLDVHGYYSPAEPMVMYYPDGSGHPGCSAEFEIISVSLNGTRITDLLSDEVYELIIEKSIENHENN